MNTCLNIQNLSEHEQKVILLQDISRFENNVKNFFDGHLDADRFTSVRLQQGVYGQRQEGVNMVRVKLTGGLVTPKQLISIAEVVEQYSQHDAAHVTTRQDIQVHYIPLKQMPDALRHLAEAGLTSREACGNTIRNATSCPLSGTCPHEHVDVNIYAEAVKNHFLKHPLTQQLPRKMKFSFSGCETDCAQGILHDIAVVATHQNGEFGFKVLAGGGLGHKPRVAIVVEEFIQPKDLIPVMEALVSLHHHHSDRTKRAKSRIKFLVDKFGAEGFVEKYKEQLAHVKPAYVENQGVIAEWSKGQENAKGEIGAPRRVLEQKQKGLFTVPIGLVAIGELTSKQIKDLANLALNFGIETLRCTQDQNICLINVPADKVEAVKENIAKIGLSLPKVGDDVVSCPGTTTCRLGITGSPHVAVKLSGGKHDLRIRVSGCQNGCAQPETGDIGIYGEGKRLHGKLIPHYQTFFGGDGRAGRGFAVKGPTIPSARVEQMLELVQNTFEANRQNDESFFVWAKRQPEKYFHELLAEIQKVEAEDLQSVLKDHGEENDFKVLQLGGGECAGAVQVQVAPYFFEISHEYRYRNAFVHLKQFASAKESAQIQASLLIKGLEVMFKTEITEAVQAVINQTQNWLEHLENTQEDQLLSYFEPLNQLIQQGLKLCEEKDPQLDLTEAILA